ncbi:MAG: PEGA domain-containing protein [Spirochaetota bacterium]
MRKVFAIAAFVLLAGSALFAQNKAALTIVCNQAGAQVYVSGRMVGTTTPNLSVLIPPGSYPIKVVKAGFPPYDTTVNLTAAGATINVMLGSAPPPPQPSPQASTYGLTVNSPGGPNSQVFINGGLQGNAPITVQVAPGTYQVTVRSPGMLEWSQQVQVINAPVTVNPGMQAPTLQLQASAINAPSAQVFLNGGLVATGAYNASLAPGTYTIVIRSPGFMDYTETFNLSSAKTISVALQPLMVSFTLSLPQAYLSLSPQGIPEAPIQGFVDNMPLPASGSGTFVGSVMPGRHIFKIVSGGIKLESSVDLQQGRAWTVEAGLGMVAK